MLRKMLLQGLFAAGLIAGGAAVYAHWFPAGEGGGVVTLAGASGLERDHHDD